MNLNLKILFKKKKKKNILLTCGLIANVLSPESENLFVHLSFFFLFGPSFGDGSKTCRTENQENATGTVSIMPAAKQCVICIAV